MSRSRDEVMEEENQQLQALIREARLKGSPSGEQRCDNCRYYAGEYKQLAYCDHPKLEILVGADWWCQWWEAQPAAEGSLVLEAAEQAVQPVAEEHDHEQ